MKHFWLSKKLKNTASDFYKFLQIFVPSGIQVILASTNIIIQMDILVSVCPLIGLVEELSTWVGRMG